jgi:hypothetical protein
MRTCCILYLTLNQYYHKPSLIPWLIKTICSITLHWPLWKHLVNRRAGRGTHLSKGTSMTLWTIVGITRTILRLCEMRKSYSLYVYETMCILCQWCMFVRQYGWYVICLWDNVDDVVYVWDNVDDNVYVVMDEFAIYMCMIFLCCDTWRKQIRQHFWVLLALTSVRMCNSQHKLWIPC